ncbi:ribonucleases G and E [Streptococcus agalactiae]|nr:ribonucleases G and E [Streptococcus agalactiae]
MNKKHKLLKNIEEFKTITQKRLTERGKFPYDTVHSTFEIKDENFIMERLKSSGLSMGKPVDYMGVNGIPIYTKTLSIVNKFAFENNSKDSSYSSNINISEDKIKENDQKILDLIVKSGANNQNLTDEEKVIAFTKYIGEITNYDNEAYRARNVDTEYYRASDLFSVTERKLAMCVGYSVTAARAFNIMGIPSYVVSGKSPQGISHAAVRAYYNRSWHIIDITASTYWKNGNYKTTYSDFIKEYCIDGYDVYDPAKTNNRFKVKYMESNEAFENWIHNNGSKSMLFINESAALKDKKPKDDFVPVTEKNNLIDKYKELLSKIPENTQNPGEKNIRNYLEKEYEELLQKDKLFKHEYTEFTKSLNLNETFYSQLKEGEMKLSENPEKGETNTN